jgi:hypothetical protein
VRIAIQSSLILISLVATLKGYGSCLAGSNAALSVLVGAFVLRRKTARSSSDPSPKSKPAIAAEWAAPVQRK